MSQLRTTFATTGAAMLLVLAAFGAGASSVPAAPVDTPKDAVSSPDEDSRDEVADDVSVNAVPGLGQAELIYVPITPCRIIDSRNGTGTGATPLGNGTTRSYYIGGTSRFPAQGGKSGGCGVPTSAMAVAATVMAYEPSRSGRLKAWPAGMAEPSAATMYYQGVTSTTGTTLSLRSGSGTDVTFRNFTATTDLIVDVTGYYVPQMWAVISGNGTVLDQSGRVVAVERISTGWYWVTWDRDIAACVGVGSARTWLERRVIVYPSDSNGSYVDVYDGTGNAIDDTFSIAILC